MKQLCVNKIELKKLLWDLPYVEHGRNSIVNRYDCDSLVKIYYRLFFDEYVTKNLDSLDSTIGYLRGIERLAKEVRENYLTSLERMTMIMSRLQNTASHSFIQGVVSYKDFLIAIFLQYYYEYETYYDLYLRLSWDENQEVMHRILELVMDLENHCIYPTDIKFKNVMVRRRDLDVKLIDLDDRATVYADKRELVLAMDVQSRMIKMRRRIFERFK